MKLDRLTRSVVDLGTLVERYLPFLEKPRAVAPLLTAHLQVRIRD